MEGNITREFSARRAPPRAPEIHAAPVARRLLPVDSVPSRSGAFASRDLRARRSESIDRAGMDPARRGVARARRESPDDSREPGPGGRGVRQKRASNGSPYYARMGNQSETCHRKVTESCSDIPCFPNLTSCREIGSGYNSRIISRVLVFRFFHVHDASSSTFLLSSPPITPARRRARPPSLLRITSRHVTTFLPSTSRSRRLLTETCSVSTGGRGTKTRRNSSRRRSDPRSTAGKTNARRYPLAGISASACTTTASSACSSPSR